MTAPLVRSDTFIRATRDSGYVSTALAVAELIDNAIQAAATIINVLVTKDPPDADTLTIAVVDDGIGMSCEQMTLALQFGGSTRFGDRSGQGRFGMGLPNASVSQAQRVDIYSCTGRSPFLHTWLDIEAIGAGATLGIPVPVRDEIPAWIACRLPARGTVVVWSRCDRVPFRRAGMLIRHLRRELGRIFRRFLTGRITLQLNGADIPAIDILCLPELSMGESPLLLPTLSFPFTCLPAPGGVSVVNVKFSLLPVNQWCELPNETKRAYGITTAATVSVLRADREIAFGWYLMGDKRRENYDDWWRCEIAFEPHLDDIFGVSNSKQGIRPTRILTDVLHPTLEAQARLLNRSVREAFARARAAQSPSVAIATDNHHRLYPPRPNQHRVRSTQFAYSIRIVEREDGAFVHVTRTAAGATLDINRHHAFYRTLYAPLKNKDERLLSALELWLLALSRAIAMSTPASASHLRKFLVEWGDAAAVFLEER